MAGHFEAQVPSVLTPVHSVFAAPTAPGADFAAAEQQPLLVVPTAPGAAAAGAAVQVEALVAQHSDFAVPTEPGAEVAVGVVLQPTRRAVTVRAARVAIVFIEILQCSIRSACTDDFER